MAGRWSAKEDDDGRRGRRIKRTATLKSSSGKEEDEGLEKLPEKEEASDGKVPGIGKEGMLSLGKSMEPICTKSILLLCSQ
ncbi:hypothetical protein LguiB_025528 [Lonicera macranthoides]